MPTSKSTATMDSWGPEQQAALTEGMASNILRHRKDLYAIPELKPWSGNGGSDINAKAKALLRQLCDLNGATMPPMPSRTGNKKTSTVDHSYEDKELVRKYLFEGGSTPLLRSSSPEVDDQDVSGDPDFTLSGSSTRPRLVVETARLPSKSKKAQKEKPKDLGPPPPRSPSIRAAHEEPDIFTDEEDNREALLSPFLEKNHEGKLLLQGGMSAFADIRAFYSSAATLSDEESPVGSQSSLKRSREEEEEEASTPAAEEVEDYQHHQKKSRFFDFDFEDLDSAFDEMSPYVLSSQESLPQEEYSQRQDEHYSDLTIDQDIMADGRRGSAAMSTQSGSEGEEGGINENGTSIEQDMMLMTTLGEDEQPILAEIWLGHSFDDQHQEDDYSH